jgi:hypothetical protein
MLSTQSIRLVIISSIGDLPDKLLPAMVSLPWCGRF